MTLTDRQTTRRDFLATSSQIAASAFTSALFVSSSASAQRTGNSALTRPGIAAIGTGWRADIKRHGRGLAIAGQAREFANLVAICDVDTVAAEYARGLLTDGKAELYGDYQDVLARDDIDAVLIATPDHWHTKIAIDAMRSGKDVYCEKPLTLTIDEGKQICRVVEETGRVFQVGTQQRSECSDRFLTAVALVQAGRIGQVRKVTVGIDEGLTGGPFKTSTPPDNLNWERWLGPAPEVPYIKERCHWTFRWWYEYSGGKLTDWGAHHVDIAQWAIGMQEAGPMTVAGKGTFAQPLERGQSTRDDTYNTAVRFDVRCQFPNDIEMHIHSKDNGILFEGDQGRLFVNRSRLTGKPVEELANNPLPAGSIRVLCHGSESGSHMRNFFECLASRGKPISDIFTHHRTLSTCHLANISLRLGRELKWDADEQQIVGDEEANSFLKRTPRAGYEIT